jgi:hypothetical protein
MTRDPTMAKAQQPVIFIVNELTLMPCLEHSLTLPRIKKGWVRAPLLPQRWTLWKYYGFKYSCFMSKHCKVCSLVVQNLIAPACLKLIDSCHVSYNTLFFHLIFTSWHVYYWPCSQYVSVLPEDGPFEGWNMKECDSVNKVVSALVGFLRKIVINTDSIITFSGLFCLNLDKNIDFFPPIVFEFSIKHSRDPASHPLRPWLGSRLDVGNHWFTQWTLTAGLHGEC